MFDVISEDTVGVQQGDHPPRQCGQHRWVEAASLSHQPGLHRGAVLELHLARQLGHGLDDDPGMLREMLPSA